MGAKLEQQPLLPMVVMMMGISSMMMPHASLAFFYVESNGDFARCSDAATIIVIIILSIPI